MGLRLADEKSQTHTFYSAGPNGYAIVFALREEDGRRHATVLRVPRRGDVTFFDPAGVCDRMREKALALPLVDIDAHAITNVDGCQESRTTCVFHALAFAVHGVVPETDDEAVHTIAQM